MEGVCIFIPTRGRYHDRQTINQLHLETLCSQWNIRLVVPEEDASKWRGTTELDIEVVPNEWRIEAIRQYILDAHQEFPYHIVIDDDLKLFQRQGKKKVHVTQVSDVQQFFRHIRSLLELFAHGSVANQSIPPQTPGLYFNERALCFHFYQSRVLHGLNFTDCPEYEDFHVSLSLIEQGYPNVVSHYYNFYYNPSNQKGGCSVYRTLETQNQNAIVFQQQHPNFVRLKEAKYSKVWKGMKVGVTIYWKKAFRSCKEPSSTGAILQLLEVMKKTLSN